MSFLKKKIRWPTQYKKQEMFQKHLCPPWCKIQVYLLCRSKTCTKQVIKGLKYIKWTTYWAQKSSLTLTFEHVTWKSIGMIYSLRATPEPSMVLIKWRGQKILTGQHSGLGRVVWPWPLIMWPENQLGIIYSFRATPVPSMVLIKWRGQKILTGHHSGLRSVVWLWTLIIWPENQ